jgi:hypothetical protein
MSWPRCSNHGTSSGGSASLLSSGIVLCTVGQSSHRRLQVSHRGALSPMNASCWLGAFKVCRIPPSPLLRVVQCCITTRYFVHLHVYSPPRSSLLRAPSFDVSETDTNQPKELTNQDQSVQVVYTQRCSPIQLRAAFPFNVLCTQKHRSTEAQKHSPTGALVVGTLLADMSLHFSMGFSRPLQCDGGALGCCRCKTSFRSDVVPAVNGLGSSRITCRSWITWTSRPRDLHLGGRVGRGPEALDPIPKSYPISMLQQRYCLLRLCVAPCVAG